jgi:transposase InsO family protein
MSTTTEDRQVRRRLAILHHAEEVTGNVAMTCRYYGVTRQSFYVWKRRYEELGPFYRLLDGTVIDDAKVFNDKLREWEEYYNYHRPHGGLGGQTPYERLRQKTQTRV